MISQLRGLLLERGLDHVVLEVGGVGLHVAVSLQTLGALPPAGTEVRLYTHLQVREDALALFGFLSIEERTAYELCTSVQQVGPKLAMSILSVLDPATLAAAVRAGDHARLRRIPGVGQKTAERLVLELRDKLDKAGVGGAAISPAPSVPKGRTRSSSQVISALVNLGYKPVEAERSASIVEKEDPSASVEELLKRALRAMTE